MPGSLQGAEEMDQLKTARTLRTQEQKLVTACYLLIQQIIIEYQALGKEQERSQTQSHPHGVYLAGKTSVRKILNHQSCVFIQTMCKYLQ